MARKAKRFQRVRRGGPVATSVPVGNTLEHYINLGAKVGLKGEQLTAFIKQQHGFEREKKLCKRDYENEKARIKLKSDKRKHEHKIVWLNSIKTVISQANYP